MLEVAVELVGKRQMGMVLVDQALAALDHIQEMVVVEIQILEVVAGGVVKDFQEVLAVQALSSSRSINKRSHER